MLYHGFSFDELMQAIHVALICLSRIEDTILKCINPSQFSKLTFISFAVNYLTLAQSTEMILYPEFFRVCFTFHSWCAPIHPIKYSANYEYLIKYLQVESHKHFSLFSLVNPGELKWKKNHRKSTKFWRMSNQIFKEIKIKIISLCIHPPVQLNPVRLL